MSEIFLRNYQNEVKLNIRKAFIDKHKHVLTYLPTGGGKTIIFSSITADTVKRGKKVMILTDREELLKQASNSTEIFGEKACLIKAGAKVINYNRNVYVAMSQTLRNRINIQKWIDFLKEDIDLFIIDEAHIQEFNYLFESGILNEKRVIGFTATPSRSGKMRQFGLDYSKLVRGKDTRQLISMGYLLNCDHYEVDNPDVSSVQINQYGEFNGNQMFGVFNKQQTYKGLVSNYKKYCDGQKMIVFCVNVEHCIKTTQELVKAGYKAKFVASEKSKPKEPNYNIIDPNKVEGAKAKYESDLESYNFYLENFKKLSGNRKEIFRQFEEDEITILVNVDIATKGYDCPSIKVVALLRAIGSLNLYLQCLGRGSRIHEGKDSFTVLDFGGNKGRHGSYDDVRVWSLWHEESKKGGGIPPTKLCGKGMQGGDVKSANNIEKGCNRLIPAIVNICPFCGFKYPSKKDAEEVELTLADITDDEGISLAVKSFKQMTFEELEQYRKIKKHQMSWLWRILHSRGGISEIELFAKDRGWSDKTKQTAVNYIKGIF